MAIIGVFMALVISRMNYRTFLKMDYVVVPMMIICMVVFPTTIRRTVNELWFSIGEIFSIQYSELMELLACMVLADAVSEKRRNMCSISGSIWCSDRSSCAFWKCKICFDYFMHCRDCSLYKETTVYYLVHSCGLVRSICGFVHQS